jgi:hypothetical protein
MPAYVIAETEITDPARYERGGAHVPKLQHSPAQGGRIRLARSLYRRGQPGSGSVSSMPVVGTQRARTDRARITQARRM